MSSLHERTAVEQFVFPGVESSEHRVSQSVHREVERVRCKDSRDCDGCSVAQGGAAQDNTAEKSHSEGCRCIEWAMSHEMGLQKLQTKQR